MDVNQISGPPRLCAGTIIHRRLRFHTAVLPLATPKGLRPELGGTSMTLEIVCADIRSRVSELTERTTRMIKERYVTYANVDDQSIASSVERNIYLGLDIVSQQRTATSDEIETRAAVAAERARSRVSIDDFLGAHTVALTVLRDEFAGRAAVTSGGLTEAVEVITRISDLLSSSLVRFAALHRETELALARQDFNARMDFLQQLLAGKLPAAEIQVRAMSLKINPEARYTVVRGRAGDPSSLAELRRVLERRATGVPTGTLVGQMNGDVIALCITVPQIPRRSWYVGVGPEVNLTDVLQSVDVATRVVDTAEQCGTTGVFSLTEIAMRAAVVSDPQVGDLLIDRYLAPLQSLEEFAPVIEDTVRAYLAHNLDIKSSAQAVHVHPNTFRYRLKRFEEVANTSLSVTETLFEVWWALERQQARKRNASRATPAQPRYPSQRIVTLERDEPD
jgi:putative transposase